MKIYAIRDRMLDYFQPPVCVNRGEDLLAAIAKSINGVGEAKNELAQAPDHYEVWRIGEVDDQGHIKPEREFIINCSQLIRGGVWKRQPGAAGLDAEAPGGRTEMRSPSGGPANGNGSEALQNAVAPKGSPAGESEKRPAGSSRVAD